MPDRRSVFDARYRQTVSKALDATYKKAQENGEVQNFDLATDRLIIFSDHHRGTRNRADDFRVTERAYNSALAYYYHLGHTLVLLGDVEELWEERPKRVIENYEHTFLLEAKYHQAGRYLRFWGNHDDEWEIPALVEHYFAPLYGTPVPKVHESMIINIRDNGEVLGQLYLVHGHQGTTASDRFSRFSKFFVRYFWRLYQRISGVSLNSPASDWVLRERHNIALYEWAAQQDKVILIAGHTHRPVFESRSHPDQLTIELEQVEKNLQAAPTAELIQEASRLSAELEWVRAQENTYNGAEGQSLIQKKPCYFNTGCCSFSDGDITGLELVDGNIHLVRFPDNEDRPRPHVLASTSLKSILRRT
jgi:hypothetical protein